MEVNTSPALLYGGMASLTLTFRVLVLESQCKGSNALSIRSWLIDEESMGLGQWFGQCFMFPPVL